MLSCDWLSLFALQGDSGGPLVVKRGNVWWLAGDTSWGIECALKDKPGVYGNISHFIDWVHKQVQQVQCWNLLVFYKRAQFTSQTSCSRHPTRSKNKRTLGKVPRIISSVCLRPSNAATGKSFWERLEQVTQAIAFKHVLKGMVCKSKSLACSLGGWGQGSPSRTTVFVWQPLQATLPESMFQI